MLYIYSMKSFYFLKGLQIGMATAWVRGGFDKNPPTATPVAPAQTHPRPHTWVKSRTRARTRARRVLGGFRVTRGFEQSRGEFDHEATADWRTKRRMWLVSKMNTTQGYSYGT
jgi:hypothetical protein